MSSKAAEYRMCSLTKDLKSSYKCQVKQRSCARSTQYVECVRMSFSFRRASFCLMSYALCLMPVTAELRAIISKVESVRPSVRVRVCVCVCVCVCVYMIIYMYIYTHIRIHTAYIHTHTHTYSGAAGNHLNSRVSLCLMSYALYLMPYACYSGAAGNHLNSRV